MSSFFEKLFSWLGFLSRCVSIVSLAGLFILSPMLYSGKNAYAKVPFFSNDKDSLLVNSEGVPSFSPLVKKVFPSVVNIEIRNSVRVSGSPYDHPIFKDPFFQKFFGIPGDSQVQDGEKKVSGVASGVIIDVEKGYIVTNDHVVGKADEITVNLFDKRSFKAELVGSDPDTDIAVIRIVDLDDFNGVESISMGDSSNLDVGDFVVAVGNPFGLGHTVTSGIVSALGRDNLHIGNYEDFIQTDASINVGNSGGALVDLKGRLVGINSAMIVGKSEAGIGIGLAIPIDMVKSVASQLLEYGEVRRGHLGVNAQDLTPDLAVAMGYSSSKKGALISDVVEGSPAESAGIKSGDIVVDVNGKPVNEAADLRNIVGVLPIGSKVDVKIIRDGKMNFLTVEIGKKIFSNSGSRFWSSDTVSVLKGVQFEEVEDVESGDPNVVVSSVNRGSPAWRSGLRDGDLVVSVNRVKVHSFNDISSVIEKSSNPRFVLMYVHRNGSNIFIPLSE